MLVDDLQYQTPLGKSDHKCLVWNYIVSVEEHETQQRKFKYWKGDYNRGWLRGTVGRTSVFDRRTFPVLRSTCS